MQETDAAEISERLSSATRASLESLDVFPEIDSTNAYLLAAERPAGEHLRVAIAGRQSAGRGRQGRRWVSEAGAGLWLAVSAGVGVLPRHPAAITLAVGATVARELRRIGVQGIGLKWPNDLLARGRKLGGILVESGTRQRTTTFVCGLGLNARLPRDAGAIHADYDPVSLDELLDDAPAPVALAAPMIDAIAEAFAAARTDTLGDLLALWREFDCLRGRAVCVDDASRSLHGIADGIDDDGALRLRSGEAVHRVVAGSPRLIDSLDRAG